MHIQISHISKSYAGQSVLNDLSLTLSGQQKIGLLGQNGSGKSTLLKIITGEEVPDSGHVSLSPSTAAIGYLPQVITHDKSLSAGQKTKDLLKHILSTHPDILLLDEPTNHLDWSGLEWLKQVVISFSGPVLFISHDRYFLDQVADTILDLQNGSVTKYGGNYSFYRAQKHIQLSAQNRAFQDQQKRLTGLTSRASIIKNRTQQLEIATTSSDHYVRRKAAKAARSALSLEKRIQKELSESHIEKPEPIWELKAMFTPTMDGSQTILQVKDLSYKTIINHLSFTVQKHHRLAVLGDNGTGKTTLMKLILNQLSPDSGQIIVGNGVQTGYLSQDHQELSISTSVLDELISSTCDRTQAYQLLRRFLLPPEKMPQPVSSLSSGEKAKLLLAKIMTRRPNLLILDEPTNHLDIPSREAIEEAIASYPGTLIVISHDRYFLSRISITDYLQL